MGRVETVRAIALTAIITLATGVAADAQASFIPPTKDTPNSRAAGLRAPWGVVVPNGPGATGPTAGPTPAPMPGGGPSVAGGASPAATASRGPAGGSTVVRRRPTGSTVSPGARWEWWWDLNKDRFLDLARRQRPRQTDTGGHFEGRRTAAGVAREDRLRVDTLIATLRTESRARFTALRVASTYGLGLVGERESLPDFGRALSDDSLTVRETAVLALGMSRDPLAVPPLSEVVAGRMPGGKHAKRATTLLRGLAALSLGLTGAAEAVPALRRVAFARSTPRELRASALLGLGLIPDREARRALLRALRARWCGVTERAVIATALGYQGDEDVLDALFRLMRDRSVEVRRSAVLAVGAFPRQAVLRESLAEARRRLRDHGDTTMSPFARERLQDYVRRVHSAVERERNAEATAWGKLRHSLRYLMTKDADQSVRAFATISLGQVGDITDAEAIGRAMLKGPMDTRAFAALSLGLLARNHVARSKPLTRLMRSRLSHAKQQRFRAALMIGLGLARDVEAGEAIAAHVTAQSAPYTRGYGATALGLIGNRQHAGIVAAEVARAREINELQNAALGLALIGGPAEVAVLRRQLMTSEVTQEQIAASVGLSFLGGPDVYRTLMRFLRAPSKPAAARAFVAEGLGLAMERRAPTPLSRITTGYNFLLRLGPVDRVAALKW